MLLCGLAAGGCSYNVTRFDILDHRTEGDPARYFEEFDECYYTTNPLGGFDVVARRVGIGQQGPDERITQIVHLRGIWCPIPGHTHAESTMINATVSYMIISGAGGAGFEGGGFISFRENYKKTVAVGKLELAKLAPVRCLGQGRQIFERAEVRGEFHATRDPRQVTRILAQMRRLFGPLPRYEPPPADADVL